MKKFIKIKWTEPYWGVSHVILPGKWTITRVEHGAKMNAYIVDRQSDTPFTPVVEVYGKSKYVKEVSNRWAREIINRTFNK